MAYLDTDGLDDLLGDFARIADLPIAVQQEMLQAEADIVVKAHKEMIDAMGLRDTGQLRDSIARDVFKGGLAIDIYPQGRRDDGVRNAEVGFVLEFGAPHRGLPAFSWMEKANEACADEAVNEAWEAYDQFLKENNL